MRAITGGPPSTGSSLLVRIMNRHSKVYCSHEESHLFSKDLLYTSWSKNKHRILKKGYSGLRSSGWHLYNGIRFVDSVWSLEEIEELIDQCSSFEIFATRFYDRYLLHDAKQIWIEKTPGNVLCFSEFLNQFDDSIVIATIRNPFEIIASLINRGRSVYQAVGITLTNYAVIPNFQERLNVIKYEELSTNPRELLTKLCKYLTIDFEDSMLIPDSGYLKMKGWKHSETGAIAPQDKSRFEQLDPVLQKQIRYATDRMVINDKWNKWKGGEMNYSIRHICARWGYKYREGESMSFGIESQMRKDKVMRTRRGYPTHILNYPVKLK